MATFAHAATASSAVDNDVVTTASFTPAANDILVAIALVGGQASGGTFTDSQSVGWTQVLTALKNTSADTLVVAVSNGFTAASSMTVTFTPAGSPTSTNCIVFVFTVSGMSLTGASAVRQSAKEENQAASGTPAPVLGSAAITTNPVFVVVGSAHDTSTQVADFSDLAPTGFTIDTYSHINSTPDFSMINAGRSSGFTGTTPTWQTTCDFAYCSAVIELDATAAAGHPAAKRMGGVGFASHGGYQPTTGRRQW